MLDVRVNNLKIGTLISSNQQQRRQDCCARLVTLPVGNVTRLVQDQYCTICH